VAIMQEVGVESVQQFERYLGLPALIGRSRVSSFNFIKGRIWTKLNDWKEKLLTHEGKEILLKTVIQAIPTYTMVALLNGGHNPSSQWSVPAVGNFKINWDAALDGCKKLMGVGIVARDLLERVMATMCAFLPYIRDPTTAEAIGA